ncbi:MAG TPA: thioredoxin-dependent thiol peroxidase [Longimicrobiales bacterium]|nr:thioredoxin-dependent thiol peroxidase [Longimicrobiales bacterium]
MVAKGVPAPDFTLPTDAGESLRLSSLRGRKVVLYFYPKDDTSGCTAQACELRDALPRFDGVDAVILGVSPDGVASHRKFRDKHRLNFTLLSDEDHSVAEAYGVWAQKSMYGRTYMGIERSTFLIGEDGTVLEAWRKVKPEGHAALVAAALGA